MLLVTGAAGFIGSNVLSALNARGIDDIIAVDDLSDGRKCLNLAGKKFADYRDYRELRDKDSALRKLPNLTGIIHLGAISSTTMWDGRAMMEANYRFSKRMLSLAAHRNCAFIYASSASVYGDGLKGFREQPENEQPKSPYAFSKWAFDQYVRRQIASRRLEIPVAGMRYFNVYGPGEDHKDDMASFVYKCFCAIRDKTPIKVFEGSQDILRDFIYVKDAAEITVDFLNYRNTGIYNVGTGVATSFLDVAELVADDDKSVEIRVVPFPQHLRRGYQTHTQADTSKLLLDAKNLSPAWFTTVAVGIAQYRKEFFK